MNKVLVLTDNVIIFERFKDICDSENRNDVKFDFFCSPSSKEMFEGNNYVNVLDIQKEYLNVISNYSLVISCHCKKIFPEKLVNSIRCINIHPGLNPFNRGWYPQVFAINNGFPHGATIHEMDEKIDHGNIIVQKKVDIKIYDTSKTVYDKVVDAEVDLFKRNFNCLLSGDYQAHEMIDEGNYNSINDFKELCEIDLNKEGTFKDFYNLLRSLQHEPYSNAYFVGDCGEKIMLSLKIESLK
ncbi:hypothetical protein A9261_18885 [Vibrio tasmaniensis]|nr:hypothetical protein A9261_18885 [Vibrio tasmaniensis]